MKLLDKLFPPDRPGDDGGFVLPEGWRRLCLAASGLWLMFWLVKAGILQVEIWRCYDVWGCRNEVRQIWLMVVLAFGGPVLLSFMARLVCWIARGFSQTSGRR